MWHPEDECVAASNRAAFIEWLRATGARPPACPSDLTSWREADPSQFYAAVGRFAGIGACPDVRTSLLRWRGPADALVLDGSPPRVWSRDQLRADPPAPIERLMRRLTPDELACLAADHLFGLEIRPRNRVFWTGDPDDPWPLGVWLIGATLLLPDADYNACPIPTPDSATIVLAGRPGDRKPI